MKKDDSAIPPQDKSRGILAQSINERFTDILSQEYNVENLNIRWSRIGQLLINSSEY